MEAKISVIVPVYNIEVYLAECIESILAQTYHNFELILIDDGSTDQSGKICDRYALQDSRIIVTHKENGGVSSARNAGLEIAGGEYICFVDGDDYVMPEYIEYLYRLITDKQADISMTMQMDTTYKQSGKVQDHIVCMTGEEAAISILTYNVPIGVYCKMFNTAFLRKNKIHFEPDLYIGEGFNFNTDAFEVADKVVAGKKHIYHYRLTNTTSATTAFSVEKWENGLLAIKKIQNKLKFNDPGVLRAWNYAWWNTNRGICDLILKLQIKKNNLEFYHRCRKEVKTYIFSPFFVRVSFIEKIRPLFVLFLPGLIPGLMRKRNYRYNIKQRKS